MAKEHCRKCKAWCCKNELPYASKEELNLLYLDYPQSKNEILQKPDGSCIFLSKNSCLKYHIRPLECRIFPFDIFEKNGILWWGQWLECPVIYDAEETISRFEKELIPYYPAIYFSNYIHHREVMHDGNKYKKFKEIRAINFLKNK